MTTSAAIEGVSGAVGAVIALVTTYPLLRVTAQETAGKTEAAYEARKQELVPWDKWFEQLLEDLDISQYYRGLKPSLIGTLLSSGIYFYLYAELKRMVLARNNHTGKEIPTDLSLTQSFVVAWVAGCGNVLAANPIWLVAHRMQTAGKEERETSFVDEFRALLKKGGIQSLWRGTLPALVMVINPTIQYALLEWTSALWRRRRPAHARALPLKSWEIFLLSAAAKLVTTLVTFPMMVVKSRIQGVRSAEEAKRYSSISSTIVSIWNKEGVLGFFRGLRTKVVQSVLAAALMLMLKERLSEYTELSLKRLNAGSSRHVVK